jgi:hypothetical protein
MYFHANYISTSVSGDGDYYRSKPSKIWMTLTAPIC